MNDTVLIIPASKLALSLIPVLAVLYILYRWSSNSKLALYAVFRMLTQLLIIGYALSYIFAIEHPMLVILVLIVMLTSAGLICLKSVRQRDAMSYGRLVAAITAGAITTLLFMTSIVLELNPWYLPHYMIPLAGMTIANCMNTVSLAAERYDSESARQSDLQTARRIALNASLIPNINALFAVGIVSLPGMMTGQILSGVDPLIAVRYQIMVMCMVFSSSGIASICYLLMQDRWGSSVHATGEE